MSKTYRDDLRGRLRRQEKDFDENEDNYEWVWRRVYTLNFRDWMHSNKGYPRDEEWRKVKTMKIELYSKNPYSQITERQRQILGWTYGKNPSSWNRTYHRRPNRRRDKTAITELKKRFHAGMAGSDLDDLEEGIEFSHPKKPCMYYW